MSLVAIVLVASRSLSARVDFPWSICAIMLKLRILSVLYVDRTSEWIDFTLAALSEDDEEDTEERKDRLRGRSDVVEGSGDVNEVAGSKELSRRQPRRSDNGLVI